MVEMLKVTDPRSPILRYGIALVAVVLALLLTLSLSSIIKPIVFPLFFVAVAVSAWYGGLGSGLLATGLAVPVIDYFFRSLAGRLTFNLDDFVWLAVFMLVALVISSLAAARKRGEQALRQSELRFRSVAQAANDAIIIADDRGDIILWNRGAQTIFGYQEKEVVGKSLTILMPERYREMHSTGLQRLSATGESTMIGKTVELHGLRRDGSEFPLELSLGTWHPAEGIFYSGIIRDITMRKQAQQELQTAHAELEARVQERTAELSIVNAELRQEISAHQRAEEQKQKLLQDLRERVKELEVLHQMARLLQNEQKPIEALLPEITSILPPAWKHDEVAAARIIFDGVEYTTANFFSTPWKLRAGFTTPEGKHGALEVVYLKEMPDEVEGPFLADERRLINSLAELLMSYLERKETETRVAQVTRELVGRNEELWRLQKEMGRVEPLAALGRVTGMIAHELGTPLNTVLGHSQFLGEEELTGGGRRRLKTIQEQIHRMVDTVQYYLTRTRVSQSARSQINVNELVLETLVLLKPDFEQYDLEVNTTLAEPLAPLPANRGALQRVLINLFNNAVDALKEGGTVTITTRAASRSSETSKEGIMIEITDTGSGIPPEMLPKVFDLFLTTKESGKGTGLGLAVCQEIVKSHGGTIQITSKLGEGTRVRVFLPTDDTVAQPASAEVRE
jgi:PAS domain S-box-containing protein